MDSHIIVLKKFVCLTSISMQFHLDMFFKLPSLLPHAREVIVDQLKVESTIEVDV